MQRTSQHHLPKGGLPLRGIGHLTVLPNALAGKKGDLGAEAHQRLLGSPPHVRHIALDQIAAGADEPQLGGRQLLHGLVAVGDDRQVVKAGKMRQQVLSGRGGVQKDGLPLAEQQRRLGGDLLLGGGVIPMAEIQRHILLF